MPRHPRQTKLNTAIMDIITRTAEEITQAVRQNIAEEIGRVLGTDGLPMGLTAPKQMPVEKKQKRAKILCPVPKCGKPTGGPRWGWFCGEHKDLSEAEKDKYRALRHGKIEKKVKAAKKAVKGKKVKKAKEAKASKKQSSPTTPKKRRVILCPVPGCGKPGKGPRYAWFCEDHRGLPAEEKAKIREGLKK